MLRLEQWAKSRKATKNGQTKDTDNIGLKTQNDDKHNKIPSGIPEEISTKYEIHKCSYLYSWLQNIMFPSLSK
jgi:hypothetical protein